MRADRVVGHVAQLPLMAAKRSLFNVERKSVRFASTYVGFAVITNHPVCAFKGIRAFS
jgi:hypothetical protein